MKSKPGKPKAIVKPKTRKELRKEKRQQKKVHRKDFFSSKKPKFEKEVTKNKKPENKKVPHKTTSKPGRGVLAPPRLVEDGDDFEDEEISSSEDESGANEKMPKKVVDDPMERFRTNLAKEKKEEKQISKSLKRRRKHQLKEEIEGDDREIKKYGKKLRIDHSRAEKAVPKSFDDGLDYMMELCLPNIEADQLSDLDEDDFRNDLKMATGKQTSSQAIEKKDMDSDSDNEASEFEEDSDEDVQELPTKSVRSAKFPRKAVEMESESDDFDEEDPSEESGDSDSDQSSNKDDEEDPENEDNSSAFESEEDQTAAFEDIYGRTRDTKSGKVIESANGSSKYVPPHLRQQEGAQDDPARSEKLLRLRRQLKGSINRLAEQNLHKIVSELEDLYMRNSRHDMNETITKLITAALIGTSLSPERMVMEHCLLVATLHANVGTEVGAHFLQDMIKRFDNLMNRVKSLNVEDKELDNIVLILAHLYTFKVYDNSLVFEMLDRLMTDLLDEKCIECVLLVLRSVGFVLRKDNPLALKEFIVAVQRKAAAIGEQEKANNTRLKFMLDILMAVKNNNMNKIPNYDSTVAEHLRKVMKTVLGPGKYVSTMKIPMDDLLKSEERGKWWVVGSAWTGKTETSSGTALQDKITKIVNSDNSYSQKLLDLAKKHRMSTDDRKNAFCIIMGAEDYLDAFEKLLHLAIKDQKVIPSVVIHCCLSEREYNPYYAALAQKFCDFDRKYQLAFQFNSWDKIRELESWKSTQISNFAQFLATLIMEGGQPLSIMKVIEFGSLNKATMKFVRQILLAVLLKDETVCRSVFMRIARSNALNAFKDSIKLFLHHFLAKGAAKSDLPAEEMELLKRRISLADQCLNDGGDMF